MERDAEEAQVLVGAQHACAFVNLAHALLSEDAPTVVRAQSPVRAYS